MDNIIDFLYEIGQLVDQFDIQLVDSEKKFEDIELSLIESIESKFAGVDLQELNNDEKIIYFYTHANYLAIVKRLALKNFNHMKENSQSVKPYKTYDDFEYNNYFERINEYREAMSLINSGTDIINIYTSQVYVNYANILLEMGRVAESAQALKDYNKIVKGFPMARANLAIKHMSLATRTTDESVMRFLLDKGLKELSNVIDHAEESYIPLDVLEQFHDWEHYFERSIDKNLSNIVPWQICEDAKEEYKVWCSKNHLSLNYINVIYPYGNIDNIHMPNMGMGYFEEEYNMEYYAWFNTIKQEYNMSRYLLYQINDMDNFGNNHESQNHNYLVNTLDYPAIGYKTEMLKNSLKTAFSVLDKIGLFCCHFHRQDIPVHRINFHKWYKEIDREIALKSPFNALYWLSQDLDRKNGAMKEIRLLRNVIEHRYIRVLEYYDKPLIKEIEENKFEYIISYETLEDKAYETLRLVRNAIFYMASGFNMEFNRFYYDPEREHPFLPLLVDEYDDEWKN